MMHESLKQLDALKLNFGTESMLYVNFALSLIMFGVALGIKGSDFRQIVKQPRAIIVGVLSQFLILPAVTFLIIFLFRNQITQTVAMGMLLVASCPGGNISNFMSAFAKGNAALSVGLTAIATVAAIVLTPANFTFWGSMYASSSELVRPLQIPLWEVFQTVFFLLGIPLALGMLTAWRFPDFTKKIIRPLKLFSIIVFLALVVGAFLKNYDLFIHYIKYVFVLVLIHNLIGFASGYLSATLGGVKDQDRRTITIETGIQNSGLALVLIFNPNIFPEDSMLGGMAFIAGWWGVWHIVSGLLVSGIWSRLPYAKDVQSKK